MLVLATQFDVSAQRVMPTQSGCNRWRQKSAKKVPRNTFVQHARFVEVQVSAHREFLVDEPYFIRPRLLGDKKADDVLEAFLSNLPIDIVNVAKLEAYLAGADCGILAITVDRASAGYLALKWVFRFCRTQAPEQFAPLALPCVSQGCASAKCRNRSGRDIAMALNSFARQVRAAMVEKRILHFLRLFIQRGFTRRHEKRPTHLRARAAVVVHLSYDEEP